MLVGDARETLSLLGDALRDRLGAAPRPVPAWVSTLRDLADAAARDFGRRWLPWVEAIQASLDDDAVVATDNAMCVYYGLLPNLVRRHPAATHFPTGFGTLGFTVPVAIGAALASPGRQVVGVSGDGGLLFTVTEIATAAAEELPIAVVVFDNGGYGEIRHEMLDRGETPVAVAAPPRDLVALASALGAHAMLVDSPGALALELQAARHRTGPTVIVVPEPPREV
jgi:acetolactate synthase-1/2/3 large subunit